MRRGRLVQTAYQKGAERRPYHVARRYSSPMLAQVSPGSNTDAGLGCGKALILRTKHDFFKFWSLLFDLAGGFN